MNGNPETPHWAIWLGRQSRDGKITREVCRERLDELIRWDQGGPRPEWMRDGPAPRVGMFEKP